MTNQSTNIYKLLCELTRECTYYYIKTPSTLFNETKDGNTIYTKYKKYNGKVNSELINQHIKSEITLAVPINKDNSLIFNYYGDKQYIFTILLKELFELEGINNIVILDKAVNYLSIYISVPNIYNMDTLKKNIETYLEEKLPKEWSVLPKKNKPNIVNIMHLPNMIYEI